MGGVVNKCLFPKPSPPTYSDSDPHLKWVQSKNQVPVLFLENEQGADKVIFFFHGNAEDLGSTDFFTLEMMKQWKAHAVAMEYPTYGAYKDGELNQKTIQEDSLAVYDEVKKQLGLNSDQIIILGRSIGSGPATYLASQRQCGCFVLISPLKSIEEVAGDMCCLFKCLCLCKCCCPGMPCYYFKNKELISKIQTPTFIVHGEKDQVIPVTHGRALAKLSPAAKVGDHYPPHMTHNNFNIKEDIVDRVREFLELNGLLGENKKKSLKKIEFAEFRSSNTNCDA